MGEVPTARGLPLRDSVPLLSGPLTTVLPGSSGFPRPLRPPIFVGYPTTGPGIYRYDTVPLHDPRFGSPVASVDVAPRQGSLTSRDLRRGFGQSVSEGVQVGGGATTSSTGKKKQGELRLCLGSTPGVVGEPLHCPQ